MDWIINLGEVFFVYSLWDCVKVYNIMKFMSELLGICIFDLEEDILLG